MVPGVLRRFLVYINLVSSDVNRAMLLVAGTRFQATGQEDKEEDVVGEYENEADCFGHHCCPDSHHNLVHLSWL